MESKSVIKIESGKLKKTVWIAEDRQSAREIWKSGSRDTIYLFREVTAMQGINEESLGAVQMVKEVFPGAIVEKINETGSDVPPCKPLGVGQVEPPKVVKNQGRQIGLWRRSDTEAQ